VVATMSRTVHHSACEGLPELRSGSHLSPEDGACLMEYVSVIAGTPFSDHPRCTDPTLAALARFVNDASTDAGRPLLTAFAPELAGTGPVDPRGTAAIVLATVSYADEAAGEPAALRRTVRRAQRWYDRVTGAGALASLARHLDPVHRRGTAYRCLEKSVVVLRALPEARRDSALQGALAAAMEAAVASTGRPRRDGATESAPRRRTHASRSTTADGARNIVRA
jgi:hypothetical protein